MATSVLTGRNVAISFAVIFGVALFVIGIYYAVVYSGKHTHTMRIPATPMRLAPGGAVPTGLAPGAVAPGPAKFPVMQRGPRNGLGSTKPASGGASGLGSGMGGGGFGGVGGTGGADGGVKGPGLPVAPTPDNGPGLEGLPRAQQELFAKAQNAERRSEALAKSGGVAYGNGNNGSNGQGNGQGNGQSSGAAGTSVHLPAGASDQDASVAAQAAALKARYGFSELPGGAPMQSVIATTEGKSLSHAGKTTINNTGALDSAWADDSSHLLRKFLPEEADKLDKALSMSATPSAFYNDDATHEVRRRTEMIKAMLLEGAVDPSIEDVLGTASPFQASRNMLLRAVTAQDQLDRTMVNRPPTRFLYQNPLWREATSVPTMSSIVQDNMTPGQQYYLQSISCAAQNAPIVYEPY